MDSHANLVPTRRGVTLVEMLIVVAIVGLIAGISFPAVSSGLESLRLPIQANQDAAREVADRFRGRLFD